jgi:CBS domain-containing protein
MERGGGPGRIELREEADGLGRSGRRRAASRRAAGLLGLRMKCAPMGNALAVHRVGEILEEKGRDLFEIDADASVLEAVQRMVEHNVGSLLVKEGGEVVGIVTERDYLRRAADGAAARDAETPVREIMSAPLIVATPATPVEECMAIMTDRRIRHLPIVEEDTVVAMVSIGDLVRFTSKLQSFEIKYLTEYITSGTAV